MTLDQLTADVCALVERVAALEADVSSLAEPRVDPRALNIPPQSETVRPAATESGLGQARVHDGSVVAAVGP